MKKLSLLLLSFLFVFSLSAQVSKPVEKFVKGNIQDKTTAVREASGNDAVWLSNNAINFVLQSKQILKNDRELDGLAVAAIYAFPADYVKNTSDQNREIIMDNFITMFHAFEGSSTVQVAVVSKVLSLKDTFETYKFTKVLNDYVASKLESGQDQNLIKTIVNSLKEIGNNTSFVCLYNLLSSKKYEALVSDIETALITLLPVSMNEIKMIIAEDKYAKSTDLIGLIFDKKSEILQNSLCNIAENFISKTILLSEDSTEFNGKTLRTLNEAVTILNENKWTRSGDLLVSYFGYIKPFFDKNLYPESYMINLVGALNNVSSVKAVPALITYLDQLNALTETKGTVSSDVVLVVVETLGAIGDKAAFDALLATTYYTYPENVLSAAQLALSELKW